jgi:hypothetical protein
MSESNIIAAEHERRQSNRDAVAALFKSYPGVWITASELADVGGVLAWRTRVSEARVKLQMHIENKVERDFNADGSLNVRSYYRYIPHTPIGPSADQYREQTLFNINDRDARR